MMAMTKGRNYCGLSLRLLAIGLLAVVASLPSSLAAPHRTSGSGSCSPSCRRSHDTKLNYEADKSYTYDFETESIVQLIGTTDEESKLKVKGQVILAPQSACDFLLTIRQASIQTTTGQAVDRAQDLEGSSVRFAYQDGGIEGLCVDEKDPTWSANIKRALVSMLQNKAVKNAEQSIISETDISGRCPTQYVKSGDRYVKTRDLNSCTHREGGNIIFHGIPYDAPSEHNSIPGVNSSFACTQELEGGIFKSVLCQETHRLKAFSHKAAGAVTSVRSSLTLTTTDSVNNLQPIQYSKASSPTEPSSILYDHAESQTQLSSRQKASSARTLDILNAICPEVDNGVVSSKVPGLFLQLKKQMKFSRGSDLKAIREQIKTSQFCTTPEGTKKLDKLFLDAAAMSASDGAISLLADAYTAGELEFESKSYFYLYTSFASRPGQRGLATMGKLLKSQNNPSSGLLLAASGLAHQYCKLSNKDCGEDADYMELANQIGREASRNCLERDELKIEESIAALQALGNLDALPTDASAAITQCLQGSERIQIRALDAFRRQPCHVELKKQALEILGNKKKNSEIRIQAYLAASRCVQNDDVPVLQEVLNREKSYQVSSFIVSHINNQLRSSGPEKHSEPKSLLKQLQLPRNVPDDMMKYSRNFEYSVYDSVSNWGGAVDANIIYSHKSFVPSILSGNLTAYAFGRAYNLFEVGLYTQNFEHLIEKHFGPASKLRNTHWKDILKSGQEEISALSTKVSNKIQNHRNKRSPDPEPSSHSQNAYNLDDNEVEAYQTEVDIENRFGQNGVGDVYIRIMGTSVLVDSFSQNALRSYSLSSSILDGIEKFMNGAKNTKVDLTQPILFADNEMVFPTISGFPMKLNVEATTILSLGMSGKVNFGNLFSQNGNQQNGEEDLQIKIIPSSATTLRARMSMGSGPVETGLQLEGKVGSSSGLELALQNEPGKFDLKLNLPTDKIQLLDMSTGLYWIEQVGDELEKKSLVQTRTPTKEYGSAFNNVNSEILGLKLSAQVQLPQAEARSPYFPLTGPSIISIAIEKSDPSMQGYHLQVLSNLRGEHEKSFSVLLDTPGSTRNRKISAKGKYTNSPNTKFELDVHSPWKKFVTTYEILDTDALKSFELVYGTGGKSYAALASLKMEGDSTEYVLEPLLQTTTPSGVHKYVEGKISRTAGKTLRINLITDPDTESLFDGTVKADIEVVSKSGHSAYKLSTVELNYPAWGVGKLGLSGNVKLAEPTYDVDLVATYGEAANTLSMNTHITRIRRKQFTIKTDVKCSRNEAANFKLDWEAKVNKNNAIENTFELVQGLNQNQLTIKQHSLYDMDSSKQFELLNELHITRPSTKTNYVMKFDAKKVSGESQLFDLVLRSGESHKAELNIKSGPDVYFDYNLKATIAYPGQSYVIEEKAKKVNDNTWRYDSSYIPTPGDRYDAVTQLKLKNERNDMENTLSTNVTSKALSQPIVFKSGFLKKPSSSAAFLYVKSEGDQKVDIVTEYKHYGGKPNAINMKAFIKNYVEAIINETHSRTTSNLNVNLDWKPSDRRIVLESLMKLQGEQLTLDGTLKWDAVRDDSQIAKVKSITNFGAGWSMDSNTDVSFRGKARNLQLKGKLARDVLNGEHLLDVNYRNPENKNIRLYVKNGMESTPRVKLSKLNAKLQVLDNKPAEMEWENRVANIDTSQLTFEILSDMNVRYGDEKNLKLHGEVNSKIGNRRVFNGLFEASGNVMANPLSFDYNTEIKQTAYKTSINAKYGNKPFNMDLGVKFDRWSPKKTADFTYKLILPIHPRSVEGSARYTYAFESWKAFEITEVGAVSINHGVATTWSNTLRTQDHEFEALSQVIDEGHPVLNFGLSGKKDKRRFVLDFSAVLKGHGAKFFTNVEGKFPYYNLRANGTVAPMNSTKNYDFKLYHRSAQGDQSIETDLSVNQSGEHFTLQNKIENFPKRKSVDLLFTDGTTPRKVYFLLTNQEPKWALDSFIKWGEGGKTLKSRGGLELGNDVTDAVLSFDSPALQVDKWSARMSRKYTNGRHSVALNIEGKNEKIATVGMEYSQKKERSGETYDGSLKMDAREARFNGRFRVENAQLDKKRDGESGRQLRATVTLAETDYPLNLTLLTRYSDVQKRVSLSFCNKDDQDCKIGDIQFRHEHNTDHSRSGDSKEVDYILKATRTAVSSGERSTDGLLIRFTKSKDGKDVEQTGELIINEEKTSQLGYKVYRKAGKEIGMELSLPERVMSAVAVATRKPGQDFAELNVWMNKKNSHDKLTVTFSLDDIPQSSDKSEGVTASIVLSHPALPQEMKLKSKLIHGGHQHIWDATVELDVFKTNGPILMESKVEREAVSGGHIYKVHAASKSKNSALNFGITSEAKRTTKEFSLTTDLSYMNRKKHMKTSKVDFTYSDEHANFVVSTGGSQPFLSWSTSWNPQGSSSSSYDIRYEFLLPGMADARIFDCQLHSSVPPHAIVKMYTSKGELGNFYQTFIGFRSNKQFTAGLYRHKANQDKSVIGDLNLALNSSRLLFVKADWDTQNIQGALEDAQKRLETTGNKFKSILSQNMVETTKEVQFVLTTFGDNLPNLQPIATAYKEEIQMIREELKNNADTKAIYNYMEDAEKFIEQYTGWLSLGFETISDTFAFTFKNAKELLGRVPELLEAATNKLPAFVQNLSGNIDDGVDVLVKLLNESLQSIQDLFDRVAHLSNDYINWGFLNETGSGAGKFLLGAISYGVDKFTVVFEWVKDSTASLMGSSYVQDLLRRIMSRYQNVLTELIDQAKNQADSLREQLLAYFPQDESKEFILAVFQYAEKKATRVAVNDTMEQKVIYKKFVKAVQKAGSEIWSVDWENGLIVAQLPLPKPIDSLSDFNTLFMVDFPSWNMHAFKRPAVTFGLSEFYNFIRADTFTELIHRLLFSTQSLIPPVQAYSLLVGSQYVRTFDGKFYHFEGNCMYLLASDFVDKNFTLAIDFDGDGPKIKKTILINYQGETAVILPDFSTEVKHTDSETEPEDVLDVDETVDDQVTVQARNGAFSVKCSKKQDVCVFALNGFYHGKTMGLLGTNNHEEFDDFQGPNGQLLEKSDDFVAAWKLNRQCAEKPIPPHPANAGRDAQLECSKAFHYKHSPMAQCFGTVNPQPYQKLCESLSSEKSYDNKKAVCSAAAAYSENCARSLIRMELPYHC